MINIEFIASEIRENRIEYARLRKELKQAILEQYNLGSELDQESINDLSSDAYEASDEYRGN